MKIKMKMKAKMRILIYSQGMVFWEMISLAKSIFLIDPSSTRPGDLFTVVDIVKTTLNSFLQKPKQVKILNLDTAPASNYSYTSFSLILSDFSKLCVKSKFGIKPL